MATKGKERRDWEGLDSVIDELVYRTKQIDFWTNDNGDIEESIPTGVKLFKKPKNSAGAPSVKAKYYERAATHLKNNLYESQSRKHDKLELTTYSRYMSRARVAIRERVSRHAHDVFQKIEALQAEYPEYAEMLAPIITDEQRRVTEVTRKVAAKLLEEDTARSDDLRAILITMSKNGELEHPIIKYMQISENDSARIMLKKGKRLSEKKENAPIYFIDDLLNVANQALESSSTYDLAVGVALSTGRRAIEVMYQGEFKAIGDYEIEFSGQAKRGKGVDTDSYIIPTVIKTDKIVEAVTKIRTSSQFEKLEEKLAEIEEEKGSLSIIERNEHINVATARMLNYSAKKLLDPNTPQEESDVQFKDTRVLALQIAIKRIRETSKTKGDLNVFVKNFQGHQNFKELENYMHIEVTEDAKKADRNVIKEEKTRDIEITTDLADYKVFDQADDFLNKLNKKPLWKLHQRVKEWTAKHAHIVGIRVNQTILYKGNKSLNIEKCGGSLKLISEYLAIPVVAAAMKEFNGGES